MNARGLDFALGAAHAPHTVPAVIAPDSELERQAERAADAVMTGLHPPSPRTVAPSGIQRKCKGKQCAACERDTDDALCTKSEPGGPARSNVGRAAAAVASGGAPLPPSVRSRFESGFRQDFSRVRIHAHARAADAAAGIHARAFTLGNDIAFARGEYAPSTREGAKLLAHELAHVLQRPRGGLARQAAPHHERTFRDRSGGGDTDFRETVQNAPVPKGNVLSGRVDRAEIAPAAGGNAEETIHSGSANVEFDTKNCTLTLPYTFHFVPAATAGPPICQDPPNATAVPAPSAAGVARIGRRYMSALNEGLSSAFTVRLSGCRNGCADRDIPIRANATISATNPDATIAVVNRGGRGDAATICAGSMDAGFAVHEGGHQLLGMGDEYRESDAQLRQRVPAWAREERVRTDLTRMGADSDYDRFALFQERHFRFAQVFLEAAFPNCTVQLTAVRRVVPDFRALLWLGGAPRSSGSALTLGLGFDVGLPLTRLRQLELRLGAQGIWFMGLPPDHRDALLLGVTAGLEARTSPANVAATFGAFASAGALRQFRGAVRVPEPVGARTSGYVQGGGSLGVTTGMLGGLLRLDAQLQAAFGRELSRDPDALRWFRWGVGVGFTF